MAFLQKLAASALKPRATARATGTLSKALPPDPWTGFSIPVSMVVVGDYMYVCNTNFPFGFGFISKISLTNPLTDRNDSWVTGLPYPIGLAVSGNYLYVSYRTDIETPGSGFISKITLSNASRDDEWVTGLNDPFGLAIIGTDLYVASNSVGTIQKIPLADPSSITTWVTGLDSPIFLLVVDSYLYVTLSGVSVSGVSRINWSNVSDRQDDWVQSTINVAGGIAAYQSYLYITSYSGNIYRVGLADAALVETAYVLPLPVGLLTVNDFLYVSCILGQNPGDGIIAKLSLPLELPTPVVADICFPGHTSILTDQGEVRIDALDKRKHTIDAEPIVAITKTITTETHLIRFSVGALGPNVPSQDTDMSSKHKVLYRGVLREAHTFVGHGVVGVATVPYSGEPLYNVLLGTHATMKVNGMVCETLHPRNTVALLYKKTKKAVQQQKNKKNKNIKRMRRIPVITC